MASNIQKNWHVFNLTVKKKKQTLKLRGYIVQVSRSAVLDSLWPYALHHARLPWASLLSKLAQTRPSSWWCHPTISSSVGTFSCLQSFPASGSFQMSQFFSSSGQSVRVSASISVLPVNIQDWFPLGLTGWSPCIPKDS